MSPPEGQLPRPIWSGSFLDRCVLFPADLPAQMLSLQVTAKLVRIGVGEPHGQEHKWLMIAAVIGEFSTSGWVQEFDAGKTEFQSSCAPYHGTDGKGKGPLSTALKISSTDLTILAKKIMACSQLPRCMK